MHCANCARSVERAVKSLAGVQRVTVNAATARAAVEWASESITLDQLYDAVSKAGFKPVPLEGEEAIAAERTQRRQALKRIGLAGLGMMQTMMFVYALYAGGDHGVDPSIAQYLRLAGMLLTTPVLLYSGAPFFTSALHDLRQHRVGMDVPVSVALLLAFSASVLNTITGSGQVYYDSVTMFIFLLSLGRFAEMSVRQRSLTASEAFARSVPATVLKVAADGTAQRVPVRVLVPGDRVRVARGAVIPVDGKLVSAHARVDESLVTGESRPASKVAGDTVLGGAINTHDPIEVLCTAAAETSTLAGIVSLLRRAGAERPRTVAAADRAASIFSLLTLLLAGLVAGCWALYEPANVMTATLAVLVVTCPCALSLAAPATFAAVSTRLARLGLLVVKPDAIERLAEIDTVVLDKTGTLTSGVQSVHVEAIDQAWAGGDVLAIAAALERASDHPIAQAFVPYANEQVTAMDVKEFVGRGVEGVVGGEVWRLGRPAFVCELTDAAKVPANDVPTRGVGVDSALILGTRRGPVASFGIRDDVTEEARSAVTAWGQQKFRLVIASGDSLEAVQKAASSLGIDEYHARTDFSEKLAFVRAEQAKGARVLMVGDGINDAPVLASAHVSCALTDGSALAQSAADLLLLNRSLRALAEGVKVARRARQVVKHNLLWAVVYNVTMVPLAAVGVIAPWVAALGMSISSLLVVLNAARLAAGGRLNVLSGGT
jgi:Cu2+-exporting ATPase